MKSLIYGRALLLVGVLFMALAGHANAYSTGLVVTGFSGHPKNTGKWSCFGEDGGAVKNWNCGTTLWQINLPTYANPTYPTGDYLQGTIVMRGDTLMTCHVVSRTWDGAVDDDYPISQTRSGLDSKSFSVWVYSGDTVYVNCDVPQYSEVLGVSY